MSGALVYVDVSEVRVDARDSIGGAVDELAAFIEENVPGVLAYNVYLSDDHSMMTVVHVHADPMSLDEHLELGAPAFRKFADMLTLKSIRIYGEPNETAVAKAREKARMLGCEDVAIRSPRAGFSRLQPIAKRD
jgi:hypothetical protein